MEEMMVSLENFPRHPGRPQGKHLDSNSRMFRFRWIPLPPIISAAYGYLQKTSKNEMSETALERWAADLVYHKKGSARQVTGLRDVQIRIVVKIRFPHNNPNE